MDISSKLKKLFYGINIFFLFSFLGFLLETIFAWITKSNFHSGVLHGPCTIIYGFAIFLIITLHRFLKQFHLKKWLEVIIFFILITGIMTLLEFTGGMLIEKLSGRIFWDFSDMPHPYGHYISLETSLMWGVLSTLVNYVIVPHALKFARKIPYFITIFCIIIFVIDCIFSFNK